MIINFIKNITAVCVKFKGSHIYLFLFFIYVLKIVFSTIKINEHYFL